MDKLQIFDIPCVDLTDTNRQIDGEEIVGNKQEHSSACGLAGLQNIHRDKHMWSLSKASIYKHTQQSDKSLGEWMDGEVIEECGNDGSLTGCAKTD